MDVEGKLMVNEAEGNRANTEATPQATEAKQDGFHRNLVRRISAAQILVGVVSVVLGIAIEVLATKLICEIWCYDFTYSLAGAGIWCGLTFIAVGIVGSFAAKKKSICLIVALLAVGLFVICFAVAQITLGAISSATDRNKFKIVINSTDYRGRFRTYDRQVLSIPVPLMVLNILLAFLGLVMVGLLITSSVASCAATCCRPRSNYPNTQFVTALPGSSGMQMLPQTFVTPTGQVYYMPQGYGGNTQPTMQPMVMMPMNPQAPVQYQVVGQPCPPYQSAPSSPTNPQVPQNPTQVPI